MADGTVGGGDRLWLSERRNVGWRSGKASARYGYKVNQWSEVVKQSRGYVLSGESEACVPLFRFHSVFDLSRTRRASESYSQLLIIRRRCVHRSTARA